VQSKAPPILEIVAQRDDLKGLPVRTLAECQVSDKEAKVMNEMSTAVRGAANLVRRVADSGSSYSGQKSGAELAGYFDKKLKGAEWREDAGVRLIVQMLEPEPSAVRLQVVKMLAATKGKKAGAALAQRAVFDLHPQVREAAVNALKDRPEAEYRAVLLEALRYPWLPVADHAAEAFVALGDRDVALDLVGVLDQPDPQSPARDKDNKWTVPELVRVNHLGNCLLCHAPSSSKDDWIRALAPERGKPLAPAYYQSRSAGTFVRADVTYLKQDFSLMQPVTDPGEWPAVQRFDYLIRRRPLTAAEVEDLEKSRQAGLAAPTSYPQRDSVLWALRELTGEDMGDKSEDWYPLLLKPSVGPDL
jgi:hypothetical protein